MGGKIICAISFLMCAVPWWGIAKFGKDGKDPISFWSGDASLKGKVKDIPAYNREMAKVYTIYGWAMFASVIGAMVHVVAGLVIMGLDITVGLFLVYRAYKKILAKYS